ncbi:MAG: M48 family metalloprotease [candidate division WS1 bacterium]|mgnify:CR=1 FL=1|nr:M48 family metalloprotease [candidate division WS1 bacterium]
MIRRHLSVVLFAVALSLGITAAYAAGWSEEREKAAGEEVVAYVEKEYELWEDEEVLRQVEEIVAEIVPQTQRPDVKYTVKLLDSDEINAMSIPGGYIYVHRGLAEDAQSEHELAAVLAHEIAHNCTYDAMEQASRSKKLFIGGVSAALVAIFAGASHDEISTVLAAGAYVRQGILSRYSIDMEQRADLNAIEYMVNTRYNPVGLLTFMERLGAATYASYRPDYGIFETHPQHTERCAYIIQAIYDAGLDINRRAVTKWDLPTVETIAPEDGDADPAAAPARLSLWGEPIVTIERPGEYDGVDKRAQAACQTLAEALADGMARYDISTARQDEDGEQIAVQVRGKPMLILTRDDIQDGDGSPQSFADEVVRALTRALHREQLTRRYQ